jgi:calcium-dependent protein kinase
MNNLQLNHVIGRGSHGTVYQGLWHKKIVAIKEVKRSKDTACIHHEVTFAQKIHHPNIVEFHDVIVAPEHIYIIMDLIEGKNALEILDNEGVIKEEALKYWTMSIVHALETLHTHGYIYNDLKPSNIMLRTKNTNHILEPVLVDFGSTIKVPKKQLLQKPLGTPYYFAPEKLTWNYGISSDIWSLGVIQ